jgi:hypothetical protein
MSISPLALHGRARAFSTHTGLDLCRIMRSPATTAAAIAALGGRPHAITTVC